MTCRWSSPSPTASPCSISAVCWPPASRTRSVPTSACARSISEATTDGGGGKDVAGGRRHQRLLRRQPYPSWTVVLRRRRRDRLPARPQWCRQNHDLADHHGLPCPPPRPHRFRRSPAGTPAGLSPSPPGAVSYTHLRAHETRHDLVCRLL